MLDMPNQHIIRRVLMTPTTASSLLPDHIDNFLALKGDKGSSIIDATIGSRIQQTEFKIIEFVFAILAHDEEDVSWLGLAGADVVLLWWLAHKLFSFPSTLDDTVVDGGSAFVKSLPCLRLFAG